MSSGRSYAVIPIDSTSPKGHPLLGQLDGIATGSDFHQPPVTSFLVQRRWLRRSKTAQPIGRNRDERHRHCERSAVGASNGGLSTLPARKLGEVAISDALRRANVEPKDVSEVIMGQILAAGEGQNPARQAAIAAGIAFEVTAYGVNQLCGSGLRTVALAIRRSAMVIPGASSPAGRRA